MLKFHTFPPKPGDIELTVDIDHFKPEGVSDSDHRKEIGDLIGITLLDNMNPPSVDLVYKAAHTMLDKDYFDATLVSDVLSGVEQAIERRLSV